MPEARHAGRALKGDGIEIVERYPLACVNLRGAMSDAKFARAVTSVTDVAPPTRPCTCVTSLFVSVLWLGPDDWLVISETQSGDEIAARLRQALRAVPSAVTEVGDGRVVYALSGVAARTVLAKGCAIDFHPRVSPVDRCVQTLLAKASVLIHARAVDRFDVHVARSYADYAWAWFENATAEYR